MTIETGTGIIIGVALISIIIAMILFFMLAMSMKNITLKVFFFAFAGLMLILNLGMIVSILQNDTTGFTKFTDIFSTTYTLFLWVGGAAFIGILLWLVYVSFIAFNKSRGRISDD